MSDFLVQTDWLQDRLEDPALRIFDCTTLIIPDPQTGVVVQTARDLYQQAHIPGAGFLDLQGRFSDQDSRLSFTLPSDEYFASAAGSHGIANDHHLILYSTNVSMWATRMWWMFRVFGHDKVSVLDGGLAKWQQEGRPVDTAEPAYASTVYRAHRDHSCVANKEQVRSAIEDPNTCILNALPRELFRGGPSPYARPGRIKNSENLPWDELLDDKGCFLDADTLVSRLATTRATQVDRVITYCGGGIAASVGLFALALIGLEDKVVLYDNSLKEWASDESMPMETGQLTPSREDQGSNGNSAGRIVATSSES